MTAQDLKNSILQLAIQGKLVEQRVEEGTAKELVEQIKAEKEQLIKEKKIKKEKPLPEITEDEIPFEIPERWEWVRLGDIVSVYGGKRIPAGRKLIDEDTGHKYIRVADMKNGSVNLEGLKFIPDDIYEKIKMYTISKDDIYITVAGTIGQLGLIPEEVDNANLTENANKIILYKTYKEFIYYMMTSQCVQKQIRNATTKVGQPKLAIIRIQALVVPIPPVEEQKRIVAKIEEMLAYVEQYDKAHSKLEVFNKKFPEDMQKSILQYAIQGKLVEQRPEEGTAEELYQQIQVEKERLIKQEEIKKEKPLGDITEDEIPFEIPASWKWVRLNDIVSKTIKRGKSPKYSDYSSILVFAQKCNTKFGGINMALSQYLDETTFNKYSEEEYICDKDIVINSTGTGTMGRVGIFHEYDNDRNLVIVPDSHVTLIRTINGILPEYSYYFLKYHQPNFEKMGEGSTNQKELKAETIKEVLFPLPPLSEQKRIVQAIEELLPYCTQLIK